MWHSKSTSENTAFQRLLTLKREPLEDIQKALLLTQILKEHACCVEKQYVPIQTNGEQPLRVCEDLYKPPTVPPVWGPVCRPVSAHWGRQASSPFCRHRQTLRPERTVLLYVNSLCGSFQGSCSHGLATLEGGNGQVLGGPAGGVQKWWPRNHWLHKAFACFVLFYFYFIVVSSTFSSATKIYVSVVKKKRRAWYKQLPFLEHNEHWSWEKTKKPQADSAHLSPRGSGGTRCVLYIAVLLFHWQLKHLENKNKDKIFLGVTLMFTGHTHFTLFRISSLF